ncbi:MAG TPA: YfhO family protein, partial [Thermoanaerobaculia bacterium]|nr:YfhO family protein [Thermoanaerobaculia bacterium]
MAQRRSGKGRGKKRARGKRAGAHAAAGEQPPAPGPAGEAGATGRASRPRRSRNRGRGRGTGPGAAGAGIRGQVWLALTAPGRRQAWLALAALVALLCVAYGNVIFDGRSLVYSNSTNPLDYRYLPQNYGPEFEPPETWKSRNLNLMTNFHDPGGPVWQWEPDAEFVRQGLRAGEPPWWNPYVGMGTPEMANLTSTAAFPPYLAMLALGNTNELRNAFQLLVVLCGGWFTFLFLHRHGLAPLASLIGAAAFMFCGALTQNVGSFEGPATACIPFTLYLTRCFLDRPGARMGALMALGFAMAALASFPPLAVAGFGFSALYAVTAVLSTPAGAGAPSRGRVLARFALAALAAVGLVCFFYLPVVALEHAAPQIRAVYDTAAQYAIKPVTLLQLLSPVLMGANEVLLHPPMGEPDAPHLTYAGWVPLLLCALALRPPPGRERALWLASWITLAVALMKLLGLPPVQWLAYLPVFKQIHFAFYLAPLIDLLVALLAALGVAQLRRGAVTYRWAAAAGAAGLLALAGTRWIGVHAGIFLREGAPQWESEWQLLLGLAVVWIALVLAGVRRARRSRTTHLVAAALLGLFAYEAFLHTWYPRPKRFDVWRHPPDYVRALARVAGYGRVFGAEALTADAGGAFGIFQLDSLMAFNAPRAFELYKTYAHPYGGPIFLTGSHRELPPEGVLDRAAVEFLAIAYSSSQTMTEAEGRGYGRLYDDGFVRIFRRHGSPHFFFTSDFQVVPASRALALLGGLPAGRRVLLESLPPVAASPNRPGDPAVTVAAFGRNGYRLRVDAPRPGLVYAADSLLPGWSARVDGRPAAILPANYAFRAVAVPAGRSEVELSYWPPGLTPGLMVTLASALALAGVVAWPAVQKRQQASRAQSAAGSVLAGLPLPPS